MRALLFAFLLLVSPACAQSLPGFYLSGSPDPHQSVNTPFSMLHYADGKGGDITLDISGFAVGAYDVFQGSGVLSASAFNPGRAMADYIGSINVSVAGQLTTRNDLCYDCKWEVYNAYNQRSITMTVITQERDMTVCPSNVFPTLASFNGNSLNRGAVFTGRPETIKIDFRMRGFIDTRSNGSAFALFAAIGWDTTTSSAGLYGGGTHDDTVTADFVTVVPKAIIKDSVGAHTATMLVAAKNSPCVCIKNPNGTCNGSFYSQLYSASSTAPQDGNGSMTIDWNG